MGNASGIVDPFVVKFDAGNGIATNGDDARFALGGLTQGAPGATFGYDTGVYPSSFDSSGITDLRVSAQSSPNMTVNVLAGNYVVGRASHGAYWGCLTSSQTVTIAANASGNPRYDMVVVRNRDGGIAGDGTVTQSAFMFVVQGTPAGTPAEPPITDGDVVLARILVRAGTSSIISTDVTDRRIFETATGGITPVSSSDARGGAYPGQYRDHSATSALERWNGTSWDVAASPAVWSSYSPSLTFQGATSGGGTGAPGTVNLGSGGIVTGRYLQVGKRLDIACTWVWGSSGWYAGTGQIIASLPPGLLSRTQSETHVPCFLYTGDTTHLDFAGLCYIAPNSNVLQPRFPISPTASTLDIFRVADSSTNPGTGLPLIAGDYTEGPRAVLTIAGTIEVQ